MAARNFRLTLKLKPTVKANRNAVAKAMNVVMNRMARTLQQNVGKPPPASKPGNFPHIGKTTASHQGGTLQKSIKVTRKGFNVAISTVSYGKFLEGGTSKMAARPFIRRTIHDQKTKWVQQLNKLAKKFAGKK